MGLYKHTGSPTLFYLHMREFIMTDFPKSNNCVTIKSKSSHTKSLPKMLTATISFGKKTKIFQIFHPKKTPQHLTMTIWQWHYIQQDALEIIRIDAESTSQWRQKMYIYCIYPQLGYCQQLTAVSTPPWFRPITNKKCRPTFSLIWHVTFCGLLFCFVKYHQVL